MFRFPESKFTDTVYPNETPVHNVEITPTHLCSGSYKLFSLFKKVARRVVSEFKVNLVSSIEEVVATLTSYFFC